MKIHQQPNVNNRVDQTSHLKSKALLLNTLLLSQYGPDGMMHYQDCKNIFEVHGHFYQGKMKIA